MKSSEKEELKNAYEPPSNTMMLRLKVQLLGIYGRKMLK